MFSEIIHALNVLHSHARLFAEHTAIIHAAHTALTHVALALDQLIQQKDHTKSTSRQYRNSLMTTHNTISVNLATLQSQLNTELTAATDLLTATINIQQDINREIVDVVVIVESVAGFVVVVDYILLYWLRLEMECR